MQPVQRAVILPAQEVAVDCAARWQVFRQGCPLAAAAEDVIDPIDDLAHIHRALVDASFGRRDEGATRDHSSSVRSLG